MSERPQSEIPALSIVSITKDDPVGIARTLNSSSRLRVDSRIEQIVIAGLDSDLSETAYCECRWVRQSKSGIANAFNEGLDAARGEWVWFLNGGDIVHPDLDSGWLLNLLAKTKAGIVTAAVQYANESDFRAVPSLRVQWPPVHCWIAHPSTIVRRAILTAAGGFDPRWRVAMDYDLWMRLLMRDPTVDVISIPLTVFDVNGVSQHLEKGSPLRIENAAVVRRHSLALTRIWLGIGRRLAATLWRSWRPW